MDTTGNVLEMDLQLRNITIPVWCDTSKGLFMDDSFVLQRETLGVLPHVYSRARNK